MRNKNLGLYAVAIAILAVGAMAFGVPVGNLAFFGVLLVCPLMMFFMMRGGGGMGSKDEHQHNDDSERSGPQDHNSMR